LALGDVAATGEDELVHPATNPHTMISIAKITTG
jgi:hypothetical protein